MVRWGGCRSGTWGTGSAQRLARSCLCGLGRAAPLPPARADAAERCWVLRGRGGHLGTCGAPGSSAAEVESGGIKVFNWKPVRSA